MVLGALTFWVTVCYWVTDFKQRNSRTGNFDYEQGKSEGFDSCDQSSNLIQIVDLSARVTVKFDR